jgi:hypothetical protein
MGKPIILDAADVAAHLQRLDVVAELRALFRALGDAIRHEPGRQKKSF